MSSDVEYLKDRLAIQDVVMRHARGVDRHDEELMNSCYWEDGIARYGPAIIAGPEYGAWSNEAHDGRFKLHSHHITTFNVTDLQNNIVRRELRAGRISLRPTSSGPRSSAAATSTS